MSRVVSLILAAIFIALPVMPMPQVCHMRRATAHPCCAATTTRAPMKAATVRIDVAPAAPAPQVLRPEPPAEKRAAARAVKHGAFWQPLATIQLRI